MIEEYEVLNISDEIKAQNQKLRLEIDRLRLQNQTLRSQLNRFRDFRYFINAAIKLYWSDIYRLFRKSRRKIGNFKRSFSTKELSQNETSSKYKNKYNQSFKPYQIKLLHPIQDNRPKIVHFLGNFCTGGSSRLVVDLIEHLGHQFEQEVIVHFKPDLPNYIGVKISERPYLTNPHEVLAYLRKFQPHIIHIHYWGDVDWDWYDIVFQAAQAYGCKTIENVNTPVEPYISNSINYYVYVSDYVKQEFGRIDSQNITIYPGSNFHLFSRRNHPAPPDNCIGMVYRLDPDKLNEYAIDVFIEVVKRRPGTKVLIVGGGYYLETYQHAVQQAGVSEAFTFTGLVSYEKLPSLYEQMSIFVAPVYKESFGQVSPFAMNMGIPVVGYKVGALEEIIGDSKLLAVSGDSNALANIIINLLDNREARLKIGAINHQRSQQMFSVEAMIDSYRILYEEMIQSNA
jgi:glycosyltransferase involved in cell wall biosynthesis